MRHDSISSGKRKPVNLSLDTGIVAAAKEAGINLSKISEAAIRAATRAEQERAWKEEHAAHFEAWNEWVEKNGLPLERYRLF